MESGMFPIGIRYFIPKLLCALLTTVTDMEGYDLARFGIQRDPNPLLVTFLGDETPHLVSLDRQDVDSRRTQQLKGVYA